MPTHHARLSKSSLKQLREEVLEANLELVRRGLVLYTFGNASGIDRDKALVVIKPSGVPYDKMKPEHLVVTDLEGKILEGKLQPSSDLATHLVLYKAFADLGGVVHTHSEYATAWAQARREIPCFGTTHADYFHGPVPVTESMPEDEIAGEYEEKPAVCHRPPFSRPQCGFRARRPGCQPRPVYMGSGCERCRTQCGSSRSYRAYGVLTTITINAEASAIGKPLHDRHYLRKHGSRAYYGQTKEPK